MTKQDEFYWNPRKTLTHNRLFNFIVGPRGTGKTYGTRELGIDNFIKNGEQFVYVRRYQSDLKKALNKSKYFEKAKEKYPDYEFKSDINYLYIREKQPPGTPWTEDNIAGFGMVLSTATNLKSVDFPRVSLMIYDEFILDKGAQFYLPNEPELLLNLYETIARPGTDHIRVILFCLANALTVTNPYFLYFNCKWPTRQDKNGKWIWKHKDKSILVEDVRNEAFIANKKNTEFGKLIAGTAYSDYSIDNKFLLDDNTFIEKRNPQSKYMFTFIYKGRSFGVWINMNEGLIYVSSSVDPDSPLVYSLTLKDHSPNTMFLKNRGNARAFKLFLDSYMQGNVRFENITVKNICYEVIRMTTNI